MEYTLIYRLEPSGVFGVPDGDQTVIPGRPGQHYGPTVHSPTGTVVSYGTLSEYRSNDNSINLELTISAIVIRIHDNFLTARISAQQPSAALNQAEQLVSEFLAHVSLSQGRVFEKELLVFEDEKGSSLRVSRRLSLAKVTMYNLDRLRNDLVQAQSYVGIRDERLNRAIHYFQLSHLLFARRNYVADILSPFHGDIVGAVFLYLWKAATTILGDPSRRQDRYQKRYQLLGFGSEIKQEMDELKRLRDDYDVAHYSLQPLRIDEVEKKYGQAAELVMRVITQYRSFVAQKHHGTEQS